MSRPGTSAAGEDAEIGFGSFVGCRGLSWKEENAGEKPEIDWTKMLEKIDDAERRRFLQDQNPDTEKEGAQYRWGKRKKQCGERYVGKFELL